MKQDCKPGSVSDNHLSMPYISIRLKPPAKEETGHLYPSLPLQALLRMGFTRPSDYPEAGELLPHHFALTHRQNYLWAVCFCCTFLKVTFTGSYPASFAPEPGLSSLQDFSCPAIVCPASFILYHTRSEITRVFFILS